MNKICTSIEQSQKLIELGVDVNTADMFWLTTDKPRLHVLVEDLEKYSRWDCMPAWSLSALLDMIPPYLGDFEDGIDFGLSKAMNSKWYSAHYVQFESFDKINKIKVITGDTALDTAFEMIVWLKENGKI